MVQRKAARRRLQPSERIGRPELSAEELGNLLWLAQESPAPVARRAQVVLLWAKGWSLNALAQQFQIDRSTARRWVRRFVHLGLAGLAHSALGKRRQPKVGSNVRDAIVRIAMNHPRVVGEPFDLWSLRKLQQHILRRGLVKQLSVEGLRQLLRGIPLPADFWQRNRSAPLRLSAEQRAALEQLLTSAKPEVARRARLVLGRANGLSELEIASAVGIAPSSVRYWLRRFRVHGVLGVQAPRRPMRPATFTPEIRRSILAVTTRSPGEFGVSRPQWSLRSLRLVLLQRGVVKSISVQHLRRILFEAGIQFPQSHAPDQGSLPATVTP
ncbi:MAG: helix-turn-helix domain-containing protein [Candidatus Binatia bacterium]|nr:helix-turn-helix domain-containing protein [Candidatus Binatia bacterium]